jgi:hypothetical protein
MERRSSGPIFVTLPIMGPKLVLVAFLLAGSMAYAEPTPATPPPPASSEADFGYFGLGAQVFISETTYIGPVAEAAIRIQKTPWLVHGMAGSGSLTNPFGGGTSSYWAIRAGGEGDTCTAGRHACAFLGLDLAYLVQHVMRDRDSMTSTVRGVLVLPRIGVELGNARLRLRAAVEYNAVSAAGLELAVLFRF